MHGSLGSLARRGFLAFPARRHRLFLIGLYFAGRPTFQRRTFRSRRVITPGGIYEELSSELGPKLGERLFLKQDLPVIPMIEELGHREANQQRVFNRPHMRCVGEKAELHRQGLGVLGDVCVHPVGIGLKLRVLHRVHGCDDLLCRLAKAEDTLSAVHTDEVGAEDHREIAGSIAACHVHLPEPLLGSDVTLGKEEIVEICCGDGRYAQLSRKWTAPSRKTMSASTSRAMTTRRAMRA